MKKKFLCLLTVLVLLFNFTVIANAATAQNQGNNVTVFIYGDDGLFAPIAVGLVTNLYANYTSNGTNTDLVTEVGICGQILNNPEVYDFEIIPYSSYVTNHGLQVASCSNGQFDTNYSIMESSNYTYGYGRYYPYVNITTNAYPTPSTVYGQTWAYDFDNGWQMTGNTSITF